MLADATLSRTRPDRLDLRASAAAEFVPVPPLTVKGETVFEDPRPRVAFGAQYALVPKRLGLQFTANRRTGSGLDAEPWARQAGLQYRAPFLE